MKQLKYIMICIICLATILLSITMIFNAENLLITQTTINGVNLYKIDIYTYIKNLQLTFGNIIDQFSSVFEMPVLEYGGEWYEVIVNSLICILNVIISFLNLLWTLLKFSVMPITVIMAILGINTFNSSGILATIINFIYTIQNLPNIPYVDYL